MPVIQHIVDPTLPPPGSWLNGVTRNVRSQSGEDGVIEAIFARIGVTNRWCVEFGAWDGLHLSNTAHLIQSQDWSAVQIEANPQRFATLCTNFAGNPRVRQLNRRVGLGTGADSLNSILRTTDMPTEFDLLSIDIDGNDWHVWNNLNVYRPRVAIIEFNPTVPNDVIFIQDPKPEINEGCSAAALVQLGRRKGYELACCTAFNAIFVTWQDFPKLGIADNSLSRLRRDPGNRIWCCYNGKIYQTLPRIPWRGKDTPLAPDSLQIFPPEEQQFGDRCPPPPG